MSPGQVAAAAGVAIVLVGALGLAFELVSLSVLSPFNLDAEWTVPALFSSSLLLAAAAVLVRLERRWPDRFAPPIAVYLFCVLLVFAAVDELAQIHERLEVRLEIDWQLLYLPAFIVAAILWVVLLRNFWADPISMALFVASGAAWFASQLLEGLQWSGDHPARGYAEMAAIEELLEMTGSACLLIALRYADEALRLSLTPRRVDNDGRPSKSVGSGIRRTHASDSPRPSQDLLG